MRRETLEPLRRPRLAEWFATETGRYVLDWEQAQVARAVEDIFGFNAMQVGLPGIDWLAGNRIAWRTVAGDEPGVGLQADPARLPVASGSLDLLVLPHVLEFSADPHQVLRECERVLMPEGQLVIAGFNPLSLWGLVAMARHRSGEFPWRGDFVGLHRLRDWLKLLGFELNGGQFGCYAPPLRRSAWIHRLRFLEKAGDRWWPIAGGSYVIRAVKRVAGMRRVRPTWRRERRSAVAVVSAARREPAARVVSRDNLHLVPVPPRQPGDS